MMAKDEKCQGTTKVNNPAMNVGKNGKWQST